MHEIFTYICVAGAIQAFLLFLVLLIRRNNRIANIYLSLYMFFIAIDMIELILGIRGVVFLQPYQLGIVPYSFIFGPSMYLYIAFLTGRINRFSKRYLLLFAPSAAILAVNIILFLFFKTPVLPAAVTRMNIVFNGGGLVIETLFYILSLLMLQKYISRLKEYFSDIDALKLSFIRAGLVILIFVVISIFFTYSHGHVRREYELFDIISLLCSTGLVFGIAFFAILQPETFNRIRLIENSLPEEETSLPKYEKFRLPASREDEYVSKLKQFMEDKKPYLNEELTLQNLADQLSLSTHHLSMILNIHFKQNFYNFINSYRIEDVKKKLADPLYKDHNILTIAYSSGFNSKSTFNSMFKKLTGKTPKEYRSELSR